MTQSKGSVVGVVLNKVDAESPVYVQYMQQDQGPFPQNGAGGKVAATMPISTPNLKQ
jgi:hypothetical protein